MPTMEWTEGLELGVEAMDTTHREFVVLQNGLVDAADSEFLELLDKFLDHTVEHFEQENRWMEQVGFPAIDCHKGEHDRVVNVIRMVKEAAGKGDMAIGRRLVDELKPWFENHAATMDAMLAHVIRVNGFDPATGCCAHPVQDEDEAQGCATSCGGGEHGHANQTGCASAA